MNKYNQFKQLCVQAIANDGCTFHGIHRRYPRLVQSIGIGLSQVIYRRAEDKLLREYMTVA